MPTPTTPPLTPRQRELFNALLRDFLKEGFEHFTIDGAAKRYKCSKSTIYALGRTRDDIIRRVLVSFFKEIARRTTPQSHQPAPRQLEEYFSAMTSALSQASPTFMRHLASEPVAQEIYALNTSIATQTINSLLNKGVEEGFFQPDLVSFTSLVIQHAMQDIQQGHFGSQINPSEAYRSLGRVVLHGISKAK